MISDRNKILQWTKQNNIAQENLVLALKASGVIASKAQWQNFLNQLLLWAGATSIACGIIFFFAFNWQHLGRFEKFALLEILVVIPIIIYFLVDSTNKLSKASLFFSSMMLGALMAYYGQTYQTGADPWQLFANWALLIIPWVLIAKFSPLTMLWIVLVNLALSLYLDLHQSVFGFWLFIELDLYFLLFLLNGLFLVAWELIAKKYKEYRNRWAPRVLAVAVGVFITTFTCFFIFDLKSGLAHAVIFYPLWLFLMYRTYRKQQLDMFMLAGVCLSIIFVAGTMLTRLLVETLEFDGFILVAIVLMLLTSKLASWLRKVQKEATL